MKFTPSSKLVRISAYTEAYYSGATAYGEIYIPEEIFEKHKGNLLNITMYVYELDGKHSETECNIDFANLSLSELLANGSSSYEHSHSVCLYERLIEEVCDLVDVDYETLLSFNEKLPIGLFPEAEKCKIVLKDTHTIEGILLHEGTLIHFEKKNPPIPNDYVWEFDI